jgi:ERCC4-type nuclease
VIFIDDREGSAHFAPLLKKIGIETELTRLDFGDLFFVGKGQGGTPIDIGIEFKRLNDLITSIRSERLQGHQLPGMRAAQEGERPLYDFAYLLIEGEMNYDSQGLLLRRKGNRESFTPYEGRMTIGELFKRLNSMHLIAGMNWVWLNDEGVCVKWIETLYRTWTDCDLDKHRSHLGVHNPRPIVPLSRFQQAFMNAAFPGIGREVAKAAEKYFEGSIKRAVMAPPNVWAKIETGAPGKRKKFGLLKAEKLVDAMR